MRSIDLALYADSLAAEAAVLAARLERRRGALRRAAIEHEARLALAPDVVARLERLGLLAARPTDGLGSEIAEIHSALRALEALQAWVEAQLASGRRTSPSSPAGSPEGVGGRLSSGAGESEGESPVEEPAMSR